MTEDIPAIMALRHVGRMSRATFNDDGKVAYDMVRYARLNGISDDHLSQAIVDLRAEGVLS